MVRWLRGTYAKERVASGIRVFGIFSDSALARSVVAAPGELREARIIDGEKYPFKGEVDAFGGKIAFISYKSDERIGVLLESPSVAETVRSVVRALFDLLPQDSSSSGSRSKAT